MVIVYESKTGFTKKYADMLGLKTGFKVLSTKEISNAEKSEEIIFLGWIKAGKIMGLDKLKGCNIKAVCASGTSRNAEVRNKPENVPFFYLRGGCLPLGQLKGFDKFMMKIFVKMLKGQKDKTEEILEAITHVENGFDGVNEENLAPVLEWIRAGQ